ncbi:MAG: hypothetical protein K5669_01240 [Lachnospiraceae bacterium]|nr:hypothetical protein [Lachnospiraceae bacterium]
MSIMNASIKGRCENFFTLVFSEEDWDGIFAIDFKRNYVYDKEYRIERALTY